MLGVCSHPEGGSDGGRLLVSEHAPLGSLKSFFQYLDVDDFTVPFDHKAEILKQVGRGFACLAAEKIRVKNLSSESVMVFAFDLEDVAATRVKIADYGLNCVGSVDSKRYATRNCSIEGFDSLDFQPINVNIRSASLSLSLPATTKLSRSPPPAFASRSPLHLNLPRIHPHVHPFLSSPSPLSLCGTGSFHQRRCRKERSRRRRTSGRMVCLRGSC